MNNQAPSERRKTDEADRYRSPGGVDFNAGPRIGFCCLPVLEYLNGQPWNNLALNFVYSLRPTCVRVISENQEAHTDGRVYRVTVYLRADNRTIDHIEQESIVGIIGCESGYDIKCELHDLRS